ncbi:LGFP repeat-containing protein, partial [Geodermatophilus normandii]|nr:hypothetical protein [Geodermatophilus normandii]
VCGLRDGGCGQAFQGGAVYWSAASGAQPVNGAIGAKWASMGWEYGLLGYPAAETQCGGDGGCLQRFQTGWLYWHPATGAHTVRGAIGTIWQQAQGTRGLGYPSTDEICGLRGGGCYQHFQNGSVYWSPATGAAAVNGAIRAYWAQTGRENGFLGYPLGPPTVDRRNGDAAQVFQGGTVFWIAATGQIKVNRY